MQATARRLSVVSATSCARRRLIRNVGQKYEKTYLLDVVRNGFGWLLIKRNRIAV